MMFASSVRVGAYLLSGRSVLTRVTAVTSRVLTGVYAPLTSTGTLLVDDIQASCYANVLSHRLAHALSLPIRLFPQILQKKVCKPKPYLYEGISEV